MAKGRFGVGVLPMNRANEGIPGELMCSRETGLVGVINPATKTAISYDYITRFNKSYEDFRNKMIAHGTIGKIGKIDVTNQPTPTLQNNLPIATPDLLLTSNKKLSFVCFGIDIEIIDTDSAIPMKIDPLVTLAFTVANNSDTNTTRSYQLSDKLSAVNNKVTVPSYTGFETVSSSIDNNFKFDYIKVGLPDGIDVSKVIIVLNSILVSFKEV